MVTASCGSLSPAAIFVRAAAPTNNAGYNPSGRQAQLQPQPQQPGLTELLGTLCKILSNQTQQPQQPPAPLQPQQSHVGNSKFNVVVPAVHVGNFLSFLFPPTFL